VKVVQASCVFCILHFFYILQAQVGYVCSSFCCLVTYRGVLTLILLILFLLLNSFEA
jgi:hypothetical protein